MLHKSVWQATAETVAFPAIESNIAVDTAIIGGGITGMTAAMLLAKAGQQVAVVEAFDIGGGTTGNSTGNLYAMVGRHLSRLRDKWGEAAMQAVAQSRTAAVDLVERTVQEYQLDCQFRRRSWHLYASADASDDDRKALQSEYEAALSAGLAARLVERAPLPFRTGMAVIVDGQAQFNPLAYVRGLARCIGSERCRIFQNSVVTVIDWDNRVLHTEHALVRAGNIVMATHTPKGFNFVQPELGPYREYALAARLKSGEYPEGIFWSLQQPTHSVRSYHANGDRYLIAVSEDHKTGQDEHTETRYKRLEDYLRSRFDVASIDFRWSAQGYYPADGIPYIGPSARSSNIYIATGFAADGLTYGSLAGLIIANEILGSPTLYSDLYKATRLTPVKSAKDLLKENLNTVREYVTDYFSGGDVAQISDIAPGEGRLVKLDRAKAAVYRNEQGDVSALSPICTHLKCVVGWNEAEKTWDCPCHGSRFDIDGEVLEGPALDPLERIELPPA